MALNKQQALAARKKRDTSYGAEPGEITRGLKPGDRYFDFDTNTWQLKQQPQDDISAYIDTVMNASGMTNAPRPATRNSRTGSGSAEGEEGGKTTPEDEQSVQEALDRGIDLATLAAGGVLGAGATLLARRLLRQSKGYKQGPQTPAGDTAGEADKGGQGVPKSQDIALRTQGYEDVMATFEEVLGLPPPMQALPNAEAPVAEAAPPKRPELIVGPMDAQIAEVDGPDTPLANPELEAALQAYAQQLRDGAMGDPQFDIKHALNPSLNPDLPMMDQAVMQRLRAILAGMM